MKIIRIRRRLGILRRWVTPVFLTAGTISWIALWAGINTGPWNLDFDYIESGWTGAFNGIRVLLAPAALIMATAWLLLPRHSSRRRLTTTEKCWLWYALISLVSSTYADPWFWYGYWGFAFIATLIAATLFVQERGDPLARALELNRLTWAIAFVILVMMLVLARGELFVSGSKGLTGYGLINRMPSMAGMPTSRASGMSRFAAIPAIVALAWFWRSRGLVRILCAAITVASLSIIWLMQSRGSLAAVVSALAIVMLLLGGQARGIGLVTVVLATIVYLAGFVPNREIHDLYLYATRGTQGETLESMSGRTYIFHEEIEAIRQAPWFGYGWRADRRLLGMDGQNGALYALICGGFVGGLGYIGGLLVAWIILLRVIPYRRKLRAKYLLTLVQAAGMLTFFTVRSYPENAAALYSVDLMVLLPAIIYIGELDRRMRAADAIQRIASLRRARSASSISQAIHASN